VRRLVRGALGVVREEEEEEEGRRGLKVLGFAGAHESDAAGRCCLSSLASHMTCLVAARMSIYAGLEKRVAHLSRHDLLDLCLERGLGQPNWSRDRLQHALIDYTANIQDLTNALRANRPSPGL
jgi:hypothetical protein